MPIDSLNLDTCGYVVHSTKFDVPRQYTVLDLIGQGAYGVVCAARDELTHDDIAIKKIESAFEHVTYTKRTLRELRILRHLRHENVIDIRGIFMPGHKNTFEDIYVVSELMETDLASILKSPQVIMDDHCQFFLYQILRGMKYVHSAQVIHRDLKPRNLLVNANCDLKICDFGLARMNFHDREFQPCPMTEYVCTRWYRATEVLCSWINYTSAIDVWSIGCIFAEMLMRKPLFPGKNTQHQLQLIISFLGTRGNDELQKIPNEKCRRFINSMPHTPEKPFPEVFKGIPSSAIEFLYATLQFDPDMRVTVVEALQQPYLCQLSCPEDEPERSSLDTSEFEFERRKIPIQALREELFLEAVRYYPDKFGQYLDEQRHDITQYQLLTPGESQYSSDEDVQP